MTAWIPLAGAFIIAAATVTVFILSGRRERRKARIHAAAKFRSAFAEADTLLMAGNKDPYLVLTQYQLQHDSAINEFKRSLPDHQRVRFDTAAEKYHQFRSKLQPAISEAYRSIATGQPLDTTQKIIEVIHELLAFAEKT